MIEQSSQAKFQARENQVHTYIKDIVERRNGEPIKFLFLPKMGLLGSQMKKIAGCEF